MRWPWETERELHSALLREQEAHAMTKEALSQTKEMFVRYDDLLDKYHALKLSGATPPQPPPQPVQLDPVIAAINDASHRNPKLRALMSREAQRLRLAGFDDHEIIQQIQDGVTPEGLPA